MSHKKIEHFMRSASFSPSPNADGDDDNEDEDGDGEDKTDQHWWMSLLLRVLPKRKVMYWIVTSSPAAMST